MTTKTSTPENNIAVMHKFVTEVQQGGDVSLINEIMHPQFYDHSSPKGALPEGRDGPRAILQSFHAAFSEIKVDIVHCIASGDVVATNKIIYGRHVGDFHGRPATGQRVRFDVMDFVRFEDGMFREHWATVGPMTVVEEMRQ